MRNSEKNSKVEIYLEDVGNSIDIVNSNPNLRIYLEGNKKNTGNIIVISRAKLKSDIYEIALDLNVMISFVSVSKLRNEDYDLSIFKNKVVIFNKCFDGMTSEHNNTHKNIMKIIGVCDGFLGVDTIGSNYMKKEYFPALLKTFGVNISHNIEQLSNKDLNILLDKYVKIVKNNVIVKADSKNYWQLNDININGEKERFFFKEEPSQLAKMKKTKQESTFKVEDSILIKDKTNDVKFVEEISKYQDEIINQNAYQSTHHSKAMLNNKTGLIKGKILNYFGIPMKIFLFIMSLFGIMIAIEIHEPSDDYSFALSLVTSMYVAFAFVDIIDYFRILFLRRFRFFKILKYKLLFSVMLFVLMIFLSFVSMILPSF